MRLDKRVLVTGGAGFIGSHLCARLIAEGVDPQATTPRQFQATLLDVIERKRVMDEANRQAVIRGTNPAAKRSRWEENAGEKHCRFS